MAVWLLFPGFEKMQHENTFLSGFTDASDGSFEYIIQRMADRVCTCRGTFIFSGSGMLRLPHHPFNRLPDPGAPFPSSLSCLSSVSRRPTLASIVAVRAAPPAPCVTAASCPCWRTASMSPSAICVAKLATLMVGRSASPAPASSSVWQTVGPSREPVSERERAAVCDGQLVRTVSAPVLL